MAGQDRVRRANGEEWSALVWYAVVRCGMADFMEAMMAKDRNGQPLAVGDSVVLRGRVTRLHGPSIRLVVVELLSCEGLCASEVVIDGASLALIEREVVASVRPG